MIKIEIDKNDQGKYDMSEHIENINESIKKIQSIVYESNILVTIIPDNIGLVGSGDNKFISIGINTFNVP